MKLRVWQSALLLFCLGSTFALAQQPLTPDELAVPRLALDKFEKQYAADQILIIDVRSADLYTMGHIPGALSVPLDTISSHVAELKKYDKPIVAYCTWMSEHSSARAAVMLQSLGLTKVSVLLGGYNGWLIESSAHRPVIGAKPK